MSRLKFAGAASLVSLAALLAGCGSSGSSGIGTPNARGCVLAGSATVPVPVLFTSDAGLGPLLNFRLGITSVKLTDACQNSVTLYTGAPQKTTEGVAEIEWTHVNGVSEPLAVAYVPEATYIVASVTYTVVDVAWPYPTSSAINGSENGAGTTAAAYLAAPIVVTGSGTAITLDTLIAGPIAFVPIAIGSPIDTVLPAFSLAGFQAVAKPTNDRNGAASMRGLVQSVGANQFVIANSVGVPLTVFTSAATVFQGIGSVSALPVNGPASVDVAIQPDGSLLATRVEVENTATVGAWSGPLTGTYFSGMGQEIEPTLWEQANDPFGNLTSNDSPLQFQFTANTIFQHSGSAIDLVDLPFTPRFASFADVRPGQGLSIDWSTMQIFGNQPETAAITAVLVPRTISGTVSTVTAGPNYTLYTLALAPNDIMTILGPASAIAAYSNQGTRMEDGAPAVGALVNVHGLLFSDAGTLRLVADQIRLQQTPE